MKAIIEFDLPDEDHYLKVVLNSRKYLSTIVNFSEWMRSEIKYSHVKIVNLEEVRKHFLDILKESGADIDD